MKTESKHTPGPWTFDEKETDGRMMPYIRAGEPMPGAKSGRSVCCATMTGYSEWRANARLIAAAPDMRDALHGMMLACYGVLNSCKDSHNNIPEKYRLDASAALLAASKALDKAEGK